MEETYVLDAKGNKVEPNLIQRYLIKHGWSQYYHHDYWVNTKVVDDLDRQDHTNYGRNPDEALAWEQGYQKALKDNNLID